MRVGNNSNIKANNQTIVGNNNDIVGNNNTITGNNNDIIGNNNIVTGNNNDIVGNNNTVTGNNNDAHGNNNKMTGVNNNAHGNNNQITSNSNKRNKTNSNIIQNVDGGKYCFGFNNFVNVFDGIAVGDDDSEAKPKKEKILKFPEESELEHDKEELEEDKEKCVVCLTNKPICIAYPCNHVCACVFCAITLCKGKKRGEVTCPKCRENIKSLTRTF